MKAKSEENTKAAQLLISNKLYASSVHCSYYACFQLIIHVLLEKFDYDHVDEGGQGSHNIVLNKFQSYLEISDSRQKAKWFTDDIYDLKRFRNTADYSGEKVDTNFLADVDSLYTKISKKLNSMIS